MRELLQRVEDELQEPPADEKVCLGTLLSRSQYIREIEQWGYADGRRLPEKFMSRRDIRPWDEAGREAAG